MVLELRPSIAIVSETTLDLLVSLHNYFQSLSYMVTRITIWICGSESQKNTALKEEGRGRQRRQEV